MKAYEGRNTHWIIDIMYQVEHDCIIHRIIIIWDSTLPIEIFNFNEILIGGQKFDCPTLKILFDFGNALLQQRV